MLMDRKERQTDLAPCWRFGLKIHLWITSQCSSLLMTSAAGWWSSPAPWGQGGAPWVPIRKEWLSEALPQTFCDLLHPSPPELLRHQHHGQLRDASRDADARLPVRHVSRSGTAGNDQRRGLWGGQVLSGGPQRPGQYRMDSLSSRLMDLTGRNRDF